MIIMKKADPKSTTQQLTYLFVKLFVAILILVNVAFLIISSAYIYYQAERQSEQVVRAVKDNLDSQYDWSAMLDAYLAKQDSDAITLTTPHGKTYYSEDAHETFKYINEQRHYQNLVYSNKHIYFLKDEQKHNFKINVALNIDRLFHLIIWLFCTMLIINLAAILISIPLIRRLSHKWSRPIQTMNSEIQDIQKDGATTKITVPNQPLEIKQLAKSFNNLLTFQNKALQREQQFVSDASHELKTPIAAIRGHVNLIRRHGKDKPEIIPKSLDYIDVESKKMEGLINDLLALGRIERNTNLTQTNLVKIINEITAEIQAVYPHKIHTDMPQELFFLINPTDFRNIVHNLVENAAKYSPEHSDINISLTQKENQILFQVADHGIGIAAKNREKIFQRFYREDTSHSSKIKGSGLGLAIVKAEVDKYHGKIKVTDNAPQGTVFTVSLPLEK
ncbi:two-component sensor histidine kinase [Lactobacillus crispatus]|uniref:histidine kinase n=2 Tax=Lactobacillaceae TaxID=33958 RepID=A0AAN6AGJ5_9LACO|nr:HAMP domain-containing histidine kinase [Lactobacillus crispatus]PEG85063.1 sensor histidine kinase [Lactobacillus sp. UMNPBX15]KAA8794955.1 HAMP domain-containing histidine kinase [Lactobacillus crispatus]KAA8796785.1 HAMP domain-containing histidine kinase [Lactobacillus crispatus]KAA8798418.1 HAMP domain-containing histidine kinase [Lactobacillus crispatus]